MRMRRAMALLFNAVRMQRVGPGSLVAVAAVGLMAAMVLSWSTLGLWTGSWATLLMIVAFNAGLVLGFAFRLPREDGVAGPRGGGDDATDVSQTGHGGGASASRTSPPRRAAFRSPTSASGLRRTGSIGTEGAIRRP